MPKHVALALSFCSAIALGQSEPAFKLTELGHNAFAAIDNPAAKSDQSGANAGFVIGTTGVLVVDTFENPAATKSMLDTIHSKTSLPVKFVVNTHYHFDHVGGNAVVAATGAVVMAQDNVRKWERSENLKFFMPNITQAQRATVEGLALPDVTYAYGATIYLGDIERVTLRVMPGHTGGDTVVYDPAANVVFCGDLFWNHTLPNLIDASTRQWIETLDALLRDYPTAAFVPGHGDSVGRAADVRAFRDYLFFLRNAVAEAQSHGEKEAALLKTVMPKIKAKYGSWEFPEFAETDILRTDEELRSVKRYPSQP